MNTASKDIHQSFAPYFDSVAHPDYKEAEMWSRAYLEANRKAMAKQKVEVGVHGVSGGSSDGANIQRRYDLSGRLLQSAKPRGIVLFGGKKVHIK